MNRALNEIKFPFLGSLEDGETFEYILWSINYDYVEIIIFNWLVGRSKLYKNDKIDLYIPQLLSEQYLFRNNVSGIVTATTSCEEMQGEVYKVNVDKFETQTSPEMFTQQLPVSGSLIELLVQLIKDSMILKQGIEVYIKHLIPYFSRITSYSREEYIEIKKHVLLDVEKHININVSKLKELLQILQTKLTKADEIAVYIELESLREIFESEISTGLFQIIFNGDNHSPFRTEKTWGFFMYIKVIKNLEKRLYSNYNQIVLLYLKSLKFLSSQS